MSQSSDFEKAAKTSKAYELLGEKGISYVFYFFPDHSVCAAKKVATTNRAVARLDFSIQTKDALRDCGSRRHGTTTYQKGTALLRQLEKNKARR